MISTIIHHLWLHEEVNNLIVSAAQQETVTSTAYALIAGLAYYLWVLWLTN
jgi:hypothetical protein